MKEALTTNRDEFIVGLDDLILVTGATGFIGTKVVENLLHRGYRNLRCFSRPWTDSGRLEYLASQGESGSHVEVFRGNLQSREDCLAATRDARVIVHLAAGRGEKSVPDAFMNTVVTTRNLLDAAVAHGCLRRFVTISSFAVYTNRHKPRWRMLDESCPVEAHPEARGDAYCYAKVRQDEMVIDYGRRFGVPYVIIRPGYVFGPGNEGISGRVGLGSFGIFIHLGGSNPIPFTYVDNCADAIALAAIRKGIDGEVFNVVDNELPTSRKFLRMYKRNVRSFKSLYFPHFMSYMLCFLWERYSRWSEGQLAPTYNRAAWHNYWKKTRYSNQKLKSRLGWQPKVPMAIAFKQFFDACRSKQHHA
jgi:nucleoside-diphosphate-sugar epimerase